MITPHHSIQVCTICYKAKADLGPSGRIMCSWCRTLVDRATNAISVARQDDVRQGHDPTSWSAEAKLARLDHAAKHIYNHRHPQASHEDHLAHAICDLAMCYGDKLEET